MDTIIKEFNLSLMNADNMLESAIDTYKIKSVELNMLSSEGYFTESESLENSNENKKTFLDAIKEFFKKIKDALVNAVKKINDNIKHAIAEKKIKNKLKEASKILAKQKMYYSDKKIKIFDIHKYYKEYIKSAEAIINEYTKYIKKEYSSIEEFNEARSNYDKFLNKVIYDNNLSQDEFWSITSIITEAINKEEVYINDLEKLNDNYCKLYENMQKMIYQEIENMSSNLKNYANDSTKDAQLKYSIISKKISNAKSFASNMAKNITSSVTKINNRIMENFYKIDSNISIGEELPIV